MLDRLNQRRSRRIRADLFLDASSFSENPHGRHRGADVVVLHGIGQHILDDLEARLSRFAGRRVTRNRQRVLEPCRLSGFFQKARQVKDVNRAILRSQTMGIRRQSGREDHGGIFRRSKRRNRLPRLGIPHPHGDIPVKILAKTPTPLQVVVGHSHQHGRRDVSIGNRTTEGDQAASGNRLQLLVRTQHDGRSQEERNRLTRSKAGQSLNRLALQVGIASVQRCHQRADC